MKKVFKILLYGFIVWLIPVIISFFFYSGLGTLLIDIFLFNSIIITVTSFSAAYLLVSYFKKISANYLKEGLIVGCVWLALHILLDLIVAMPFSIPDYFTQIGFRYFIIPAMSIAMGAALTNTHSVRLKVLDEPSETPIN